MQLITFLILLTGLFLTRLIDKKIINPVTITSILWICLLTAYMVINHGLYPLSEKFFYAILTWYIPFFLVSFILFISPVNNLPHIRHIPISILYRKHLMYLFIFILIAFVTFKIRDVQQFNSIDLYRTIRQVSIARSRGELEKVPFFIAQLNRIAQFCTILVYIYYCRSIIFKCQWVLYLLVGLYIFLGANKFIIAKFVLGIFALKMYKCRLNLITVLIYTCLLIFLLFFLENLRRGSFNDNIDLMSFIYIYLLTPLPAFDSYILHSSSEMLFTSYDQVGITLANLKGASDINPALFANQNMVNVPLPTNVFTMMSTYYVDWKYTGLIMGGAFYGLFFGYIYMRSHKTEVYKILYASLFHILVLQSFFDFLITQQSHYNISVILLLFRDCRFILLV